MTADDTDSADLDGHTIEELSDYLDAGRLPRDESIEDSPVARTALDALARLRHQSRAMLEMEARAQPPGDLTWIKNVLSNISREARAGRDIPVSYTDGHVRLSVTEGSVRGLVRAAGDGIDGVLVGKVDLVGDVTTSGEPISLTVEISIAYGENIAATAHALRGAIAEKLHRHTELNVAAIDITVHDVHGGPDTTEENG